MSYSQLDTHRAMVFDEVRNRMYARALQRVIGPESVVLDLGAGVGVLGLLAAAAGAKRVYLVEPESIVHVARSVAEANGLQDRIRIIEGRIEDIELPEKVDVIVSVCTGNLLFMEGLLPSLYYARDRYLKHGGRLLPDAAELIFAAYSMPTVHARHIERWSTPTLGLDLSNLRGFARNAIVWPIRRDLMGDRLSDSACMSLLDLHSSRETGCNVIVDSMATSSGRCDALVGWIRIRLGDEWLSSDPDGPEVHWSPAVLPIDPPLEVARGEPLQIGFSCPSDSDWSWSIAAATHRRTHSTFFGRWSGIDRLRKMQAGCATPLSSKGELHKFVLDSMANGKSNFEIAELIRASRPQAFASSAAALGFVQSMSLRFRDAGV